MVLPREKRFSVFNEVYLDNYLRDIFDYSCKWLVFKYSYRCQRPKKCFWFHFKILKNVIRLLTSNAICAMNIII